MKPSDRSVHPSGTYPRPIRSEVGQALYTAQRGETGPAATPLKEFGGGRVLEIVAPFGGGVWRAVYTVRFEAAVYVLHAFQKKSKSGIATPQKEIDLIRKRLADAQYDHKQRQN